MYDINKLKTYKDCDLVRLPDANGPKWPGNLNYVAEANPSSVVFNSVWLDSNGNERYAEINIISISEYNLL